LLDTLRQYGPLLQNRGFCLLFTGQALSQLGDWMNRVALLVLAYRLTGSPIAVALLQLATLLPRVLVSPFGGVLADRYPKRLLMIALDLLRAILATSLILADRSGQLWLAGVALLLMHSCGAIFNPARGAILPALVPREQLGPANGLNDIAGQSAFFIGPAIGGWIIATLGIDAVFLINGATFVLSALLITLIRAEEPARRGVARGAVIRELREGWQALYAHSPLRFLLGALFIEALVALALTVLLLPILTGPLGGRDEQLGILLAMVGVGTMIGAPLGVWLFGRFRSLPLVALAALGIVATLAAVGLARGFALVALALFVNGVLTGITDIAVITTVQQTVAGDKIGRAFGLMFWILALGQITGALGGSVLIRYATPAIATLALSGASVAIIVGLIYATRADFRATTAGDVPGE
jgi:DHA3 family macrolide efflux protein-like MFS transporter